MCNCAATINQGPENWQPTRFTVRALSGRRARRCCQWGGEGGKGAVRHGQTRCISRADNAMLSGFLSGKQAEWCAHGGGDTGER